jgi:hypothetical protein
MSLASLDKNNRGKYVHNPSHDLESLLYTAIGIVTFTAGPCGQLRPPNDHVPLARWYNEIDPEQLRKDKAIDLMEYDLEIDPFVPGYWKPFLPYLSRLIEATWSKSKPLSNDAAANHSAFRVILKEALADLATNHPETKCHYARVTVPAKRTRSQVGVGRYPYKISRGDHAQRHPQISSIKPLAVWKDSVDV